MNDTTRKDPRKLERFVYTLCIFLLFASNGVAIWKAKSLQAETLGLQEEISLRAPGASPTVIQELLGTELRTATGEQKMLAEEPLDYLVLFFFSVGDCTSCLEELEDLERARQLRADFEVYGIMSYADRNEMQQVMSSYFIDFPILQDLEGRFVSRLDVPKTPWKVLVHKATGKILLEDGPTNTPAEREAFQTRLLTF